MKGLYGKQEGAVVGYNPKKPGRPSHSYHSAFMANTRLALAVDVLPGNASAPMHLTWVVNSGRHELPPHAASC
ncbi:MAG: hypothetical protein P0120_00005 [Nitrospira sp.]|nr:hypothetical protein [Nitrospira sp.]